MRSLYFRHKKPIERKIRRSRIRNFNISCILYRLFRTNRSILTSTTDNPSVPTQYDSVMISNKLSISLKFLYGGQSGERENR